MRGGPGDSGQDAGELSGCARQEPAVPGAAPGEARGNRGELLGTRGSAAGTGQGAVVPWGHPAGLRKSGMHRAGRGRAFGRASGRTRRYREGHRAGCRSSRRHPARHPGARHHRAGPWGALGWHREGPGGTGGGGHSTHLPLCPSPDPQQADRLVGGGQSTPSPFRSAQSGENLSLLRKSHLYLGAAKQLLPAPPNPKPPHMGTCQGLRCESPQFTSLRGIGQGKIHLFSLVCWCSTAIPAGFEVRGLNPSLSMGLSLLPPLISHPI